MVSSSSGYILTMNTGSSSIKFALYQSIEKDGLYLHGIVSDIGSSESQFTILDSNSQMIHQKQMAIHDHKQAFSTLTDWLKAQCSDISIHLIGHRIVHGGEYYRKPVEIDASVLENLEKLTGYDPIHMESEVMGVRLCQKMFANAMHIACFDTAFHHTLPEVSSTLPLPEKLRKAGIRKYGFHGLSYEYIQQMIENEISENEGKGKLIIAHLGSGASITALDNGISLETSMAFTSNSGLVMSTRSGDLDPGLVIYLQKNHGFELEQLRKMLSNESGLKGLSGSTGGMKELLEKENENTNAALAVEAFCYTVKKYIGAYTAVLGGVDSIVFTGGIGENSPSIRSRICQGLEYLGIALNDEANNKHKLMISDRKSSVLVRVIPTNEELMIARHANQLAQSVVS